MLLLAPQKRCIRARGKDKASFLYAANGKAVDTREIAENFAQAEKTKAKAQGAQREQRRGWRKRRITDKLRQNWFYPQL